MVVGFAMAQFNGVDAAQDAIPQTQAEACMLLKQLAAGKFGT